MTQALTPDPQVIEAKIGAAYGALDGLLSTAMMHIGGNLGLYKALVGA